MYYNVFNTYKIIDVYKHTAVISRSCKQVTLRIASMCLATFRVTIKYIGVLVTL